MFLDNLKINTQAIINEAAGLKDMEKNTSKDFFHQILLIKER